MLCHLTALLGLAGIPFGNIIGPLIIWLFKRKTYDLLTCRGKNL